jgi:hypothetical protein
MNDPLNLADAFAFLGLQSAYKLVHGLPVAAGHHRADRTERGQVGRHSDNDAPISSLGGVKAYFGPPSSIQ